MGFKPPLVKKLILIKNPDHRINNDAVEAAGELLRQFVVEARHRASIEVCLFPRRICAVFNTKRPELVLVKPYKQ